MSSIKKMMQEAEIYRSQGLLDEAMAKYRAASEMAAQSAPLKNRKKIEQRIQEKIAALAQIVDQAQKTDTPTAMPKKSQDLIKNLPAYSTDLPREQAAFEGAVVLAKFGQYERALAEFNALLTIDGLKVNAAKNIIRCHAALGTLEKASEQYQQWHANRILASRDLETIRLMLESQLEKNGMHQPLAGISTEVSPGPENKAEEEEQTLDVLSVRFYEDHASQKGMLYEFDISFQADDRLSFMIPAEQKSLMKILKEGDQINNIQFFSPMAMFKSPGIISAIDPVTEGPKKGAFSVDLEIVDK